MMCNKAKHIPDEIKKWSTGNSKSLEELVDVTKDSDAHKIETRALGKIVSNQKQAIYRSLKDHKKCASGVQSELDTIQEEKTRLLDQVRMMQKDKSDITSEISNMVANHEREEE